MAESDKEPPLCPCGFWGSVQTSGLCSKCYKEKVQPTAAAPLVGSDVSKPVVLSQDCSASETIETSTSSEQMSSADVPECVVTPPSDADSASVASGGTEILEPDSPKVEQKNKKRCFLCRSRLELAFVHLGKCKCEYIFCENHRLPEQHNCTYDHKERGRQEAREKMISPKKHVGTSLKRLDS